MDIAKLMKKEGYSDVEISDINAVFFDASQKTISLIKKHAPFSSVKESAEIDKQRTYRFVTGGDIDIDY